MARTIAWLDPDVSFQSMQIEYRSSLIYYKYFSGKKKQRSWCRQFVCLFQFENEQSP